jgi:ubiquinone/menaquinone biosynthesis C-methylase UbiE
MRILESAPRRYELGIYLLTLGHVERAYDQLVSHIERGQRVLDLGCGSGALTLRAARRGAKVKGIDVNAQMLKVSEQRAREAGLSGTIDLVEMGVAELDGEETNHYDAVMSGLCLSELSEDEVTYTLKEVVRMLRPGGLLLIADEVKPRNLVKRLIHSLVRVPLAAITYVITQQTSHPISNLSVRQMDVGLSIVSTHLSPLGSFGVFVDRKPADSSS